MKTSFSDLDMLARQLVVFRPCGECGAKPKYCLERRPDDPSSVRPWGARWYLIFQCLGHGAEFGLKAAFDFHDVTPAAPFETTEEIRDWIETLRRIRPFAQSFASYRWEHSSRAKRPMTAATRAVR